MRFILFFFIIFLSKFAFADFKPKTHTLKNGLKIIVIENNRVPAVAHSIWYKVGSADEPEGKSGIAHFLEHLLFKGTDKLKPGEFSQIVARNGGKENAFTSKNYTGYFQLIHKSKLELVMSLEADRMKNIKLIKKEFENEKTVVLEERYSRVDNDPSSLLSEQINASLYMNHPYRKPIIGWEHEIKNLSLEDVMSFYRKYYSPNNAIIVVCGDVNLNEVVTIAKKYFSSINPSKIEKRDWTQEPTQHAPRKIILESKNTAIPVFKRHYLVPTYTKSKKESLTLEVFSEIFGNLSTGMLHEEFVKNKKLATSAATYYYPDGFGDTSFIISIIPKKDIKLEEIELHLDDFLEKIKKRKFDSKKLEKIKKRFVNDTIYAQDSLYMGMRIFGSALTTGYSLEEIINWPNDINQISIEDLEFYIPKIFDKKKSVTGYLIPAKG
tara:strand:+ start:3998 stop:5311 length:1314 start_codon:yes stop_codon:yes gene_type:complete